MVNNETSHYTVAVTLRICCEMGNDAARWHLECGKVNIIRGSSKAWQGGDLWQ
jgi:hypothetical protein